MEELKITDADWTSVMVMDQQPKKREKHAAINKFLWRLDDFLKYISEAAGFIETVQF